MMMMLVSVEVRRREEKKELSGRRGDHCSSFSKKLAVRGLVVCLKYRQARDGDINVQIPFHISKHP